jgi:putative endonuclease
VPSIALSPESAAQGASIGTFVRMDDLPPEPGSRRRPEPRHSLGAHGEDAAARYLTSIGYRVLGRNVRAGDAEADIVALAPDGSMAVVEVKARSGPWHPEDRIDAVKRGRMVRAARALSATDAFRDRMFQFDVVAVSVLPGGAVDVVHWPRAFDSPE